MSERYEVPPGVEIATQWSWRIIVIGAAGLAGVWLLRYFSEITVPLAVALLGTALAGGAVSWIESKGLPRVAATFLVVIVMLVAFFGALALVGQQLSTQVTDLRANVVEGISQVQDWATGAPLNLADNQVQGYVDNAKDAIGSGGTSAVELVSAVGTTASHLVTGFFIALFAAFFFLYDGRRIWSWVVSILPRAARSKTDSSGRAAWATLTAFVRATVLVAFVDAVGIALSAWILGVPLTLAIGVLVFLGAFVPVLGALVSGFVAVLVALVAQGPVVAAFMLLAVIVVQQIETHVLQPFLMGRLVSVHPLAVILAIAAGVTVAGVVGALIAVPVAACLNSAVKHLSSSSATSPEPPGEGAAPAPA